MIKILIRMGLITVSRMFFQPLWPRYRQRLLIGCQPIIASGSLDAFKDMEPLSLGLNACLSRRRIGRKILGITLNSLR